VGAGERHIDAHAVEVNGLGSLALAADNRLAVGTRAQRERALSACGERGEARQPVKDGWELKDGERAIVRGGGP